MICAAAIYGGTLHLLQALLSRFGITTRFVSMQELASIETVIGERTRVPAPDAEPGQQRAGDGELPKWWG